MGSRDRDRSLQDKLKVFFNKKAVAPAHSELPLTPEVERELAPDAPQHRRLRVLRDLTERVAHARIPDGGCEKVWTLTVDLLRGSNSEGRLAALAFWRAACEAQGDRMTVARTLLLRHLQDTHRADLPDAPARFRLLHALTDTGKNISCFEEDIGMFLVRWLRDEMSPSALVELLQLVTNVVKYNANALDDHVLHGIVKQACICCGWRAEAECVVAALALLEAVVAYSLLPTQALPEFISALAATVNVEQHCQASWKVMRCVVGGDTGPLCVGVLARLLRTPAEPGVLRGAVFFLNMALWGPQRVLHLKVSYLAVLPAFLVAVERRHAVVSYEVILALQSLVALVSVQPNELHEPTWDLALDLVCALAAHDHALDPPNHMMHQRLHDLVTTIEQMQVAGQFSGRVDKLVSVVDAMGHSRPEASAMWVVSMRAGALSPWGGEWAGAALALAERYLRQEPRPAVRLHTLAAIHALVARHREGTHGDELVERVAVPVLSGCALDAAPALRAAAARVLTDLAVAAGSDVCVDLIDLLDKILNRPFEVYVSEVCLTSGSAEAEPCRAAAAGLREVVHALLPRAPAAHAARALLVLLDHLDHHYRRPQLLQHHPDIRLKIFEMLFGMRANQFNWVGFCYDEKGMPLGVSVQHVRPLCSPYLLVEPLSGRGQAPPTQRDLAPGTCVVPGGRLARLLVSCLTGERAWAVLAAACAALPSLLRVRAVALGRRAEDLDLLASTVCAMLADRTLALPDSLQGPNGAKVLVSEFHAAVLPSLAAFAPYHQFLEPSTQQRLVRCLLKHGMVVRRPQRHISALTMFTLEMRDTMVRMLPEVLLDLSKVSDTQLIASPMLEFLSTLTRVPRVFASFVEDQYMSVFAIVLPYTNPSRYNHYVVSLAHHVIAAWFLKCRLSYRRNFVRFIIHGLHNYIIMPFEEQLQHRYQPSNEDSSNRQRSSSLGSRRTPLGGGPAGVGRGASASAAFHVELTETCVDLLARYAFTPCSVKPQRSDVADFLFTGGQSMTWIVGHKLVTISTSGCLQNSIKQGLCDRCAVVCRQHAESVSSPLPAPAPAPAPEPAPADPPALQVNESKDSTDSQASGNPPEIKRQNSSENKTGDPLADALDRFSQRFEKMNKDLESLEESWSRAGALAAGGQCPCWCAQWAQVTVRAPAGDVSAVLRLRNHLPDAAADDTLHELAAMLTGDPASLEAGSKARGAGAESPRSRSGSASAAGSAAAPRPAQDLHKSSSDSVVTTDKRAIPGPSQQPPPLRSSTQPINIPGSPQRQSSSSTTDDDDLLLIAPTSKSRHPVRRSNSSPEMSSSWKVSSPAESPPPPAHPDDMIVLPGEPATGAASMSVLRDAKKAAKKSDMRVSCEAIPEEMSGTSPHAPPPHLMTYNSDPGTCDPAEAPPPPTDRHHHALQKTASDNTVRTEAGAGAGSARAVEDLPPLARSKRSNTISVMSPTRRHQREAVVPHPRASGGSVSSAGSGAGSGGAVTPAFLFLQLYHNMSTYPTTPPVPGEAPALLNPLAERPLRVAGPQHERTIKNLDLIPPLETFKVGVLYVGAGQHDNEVAILKNEYGSVRYCEFLTGLGTLVSLETDAETPDLFLNMEKGGKDGSYTYVWTDDVMQVLFHVATAMPTVASDPTCNEKRKYIGNDYVSIVYNDSGHEFDITTIKGQFNLCIVVVEPGEHGLSRVLVKTKDECVANKFLPHLEPQLVSDGNVALLARQLALHAALASQISMSLKVGGGAAYASNSLERLRVIKRVRLRAEAERLAAAARAPEPYAPTPDLAQRVAIDDFNDYT